MKNLMKIDRNKQSLWQNIFAVGISVAIAIPLALPAAFASEDNARSKRKEREFPTQEVAENCGGSCRGGGLTIDGKSLDSYLAEKRMLEGEVNKLVGDMVTAIAKVDPEAAKIFAGEAHAIRWYKVDRSLEKLPANLTHNMVKGTHQTMAQVGGNVFIDYPHFSQKMQNKTQKDTMGAHEILEYRFLNRVGISSNVTLGSIWDAADYLGKKKFASKEEFRSTMAKYGFNFSHTVDKEKQISVKELAKQEKIVLQPIALPAGHIVTLEDAHNAQGSCLETMIDKVLKEYLTANNISIPQPNTITRSIDGVTQSDLESRLNVNSFIRYIAPNTNDFKFRGIYSSLREKKLELHIEIQDICNPGCDRRGYRLLTNWPFTLIKADTIAGDNVYDAWGKLNKLQRLENLNFKVPEALQNNSGIMPLMNSSSAVITPLSINTNDYMACVTSELQKFAQPLASQPIRAEGSGASATQPNLHRKQQSGE